MNTVLVFLKAPMPGAVKTRLAAALGAEQAAALYAQWASRILKSLQPVRSMCRLIGYYAGDESAVRSRWGSLIDEWMRQPEGDLGRRLQFGFDVSLRSGPSLAVGTDCLDVDAEVVRCAFVTLEQSDAVIGPADDGGYYLLGLTRTADGLFDGIEWSSPRTGEQQRENLKRAGMTIAELPTLQDIDTLEDWEAYQKRKDQRADMQ